MNDWTYRMRNGPVNKMAVAKATFIVLLMVVSVLAILFGVIM